MRLEKSISWVSWISIVVIVLLLGCSKDNPQPVAIPGDFSEYINRFVTEGKARNVAVDISKLTIEFVKQVTINGSPYCGQSLGGSPPHVQITQTSGCWVNQTDINKEILIFHELGHALLGRSHYDIEFQNGMWASMMHSGNQFYLYSQYDPALRAYYLDELFNQNTILPPGLQAKLNSRVIFSDSISSFPQNWAFNKTSTSLNHVQSVSGLVYSSLHHSLSIRATQAATPDVFSYWTITVPPTGIATGSELELRVKIRLDNVESGGVSIVLRADAGSDVAAFKTTQGEIDIKGTKDFTEYTVSIPYFPESVSAIRVYMLFFGDSAGTVYFDDVTLTNKY